MNANRPGSNDPLPNDHLDPLLRNWHAQNAARAAELRDATLARVGSPARKPATRARDAAIPTRFWFGRGLAAAAILAVAVTAAFFLPIFPGNDAFAGGGTIMIPDGGRLQALDRSGQILGPCPLKHTDVHADIAGPFTRVTLVQKFKNEYRVPIEAVYTFPLGERGAVDRMRMIVRGEGGERIVDGIVKERNLARMVYEAAREQGYVASLLEQERPNIFTQSVANIEPGATVDVEISYIETLAMKDGIYEFAFPMVVGPRYIPGAASQGQPVPAGWTRRTGVVLLGPATLTLADGGADAAAAAQLQSQLGDAIPLASPSGDQEGVLGQPSRTFRATYSDGSQEPGSVYASGFGRIADRWFFLPASTAPAGQGFSQDTTQVPDASRITPMPARPATRAGHDISLSVSLDTGGADVRELESKLHGIDLKWDGTTRCTLQLQSSREIPNKDFVLKWGLKGAGVIEGVFVHAEPRGSERFTAMSALPSPPTPSALPATDGEQGFVTLVMNPPARVAPAQVLPRELVFVLDTSGSMSGFPIEKSKEVMRKALASMRAADTFNVVTFAGNTAVLWPELRSATKENVEAALAFVNGTQAGGGTEMMKAIDAALVQMPKDPVHAQPDGSVSVPPRTPVSPDGAKTPAVLKSGDERSASEAPQTTEGARTTQAHPMRVAVFLTDGYVGNDQGIVAAVAKNAGTTRVFTFGIGNNVNRYLLEEMAREGRGACDIVLLSDGADAAVNLFTRRIDAPVLMDISVSFEGVQVSDVQPSGRLLPDLFDVQPLVVHGRWSTPGDGAVVVRGRTSEGAYERRIPISFRASAGESKTRMLPPLWARAEVDAILAPHLQAVEQQTLAADIRAKVVRIGESFQIMSPYTSFVAVERSRAIRGGRPVLVNIPVEFPEGLRWEGFFGDTWCNEAVVAAARAAAGESPVVAFDLLPDRLASNDAPTELADSLKAGQDVKAMRAQDAEALEKSVVAKGKRDSSRAEGDLPRSGVSTKAAADKAVASTTLGQRAKSSEAVVLNLRTSTTVTGNAPSNFGITSGGMGGAVYGRRVLTEQGSTAHSGLSAQAPPPPVPAATTGAPAPVITAGVPVTAAAPVTAPAPGKPSAPPAGAEVTGRKSRELATDERQGGAVDGAAPASAPGGTTIYVVQSGDTLSSTAQKFYGRPELWKTLLDANSTLLAGNERALKPGMQLVIPAAPGATAGGASPVPPAEPRADAAPAAIAPPAAPVLPAALSVEVRDHLVRVLERRLLALALYARLDDAARAALPPLPAEVLMLAKVGDGADARNVASAKLEVSVLVAKDTATNREMLEFAGLKITGQGPAPNGKAVLIGEIPVSALIALGQVEGVLRAEPLDALDNASSTR